MRLLTYLATIALASTAAAWVAWPSHPADLFSCEIATASGKVPETEIQHCIQALDFGKPAKGAAQVWIYRHVTLINAGQPEARFGQTIATFEHDVDARYAEYYRNGLLGVAMVLGVSVLIGALVVSGGRRKFRSRA